MTTLNKTWKIKDRKNPIIKCTLCKVKLEQTNPKKRFCEVCSKINRKKYDNKKYEEEKEYTDYKKTWNIKYPYTVVRSTVYRRIAKAKRTNRLQLKKLSVHTSSQ